MSFYEDLIGPYEISFDITNRCNLRCIHCYNSSGDNGIISDELSDDQVNRLIDEVIIIKPVNFCFAGGEPFLRKELLFSSIKKLTDHGINTSMVSNGNLITEKDVVILKEYGLSQIQISLDGMKESHDYIRNEKGAFDKTISCLEMLNKYKITTHIGYVPMSNSVDDYPKLIDIALKHNVGSIRSQYFMPMGRGEVNKIICPTDSDYRKLVSFIRYYKDEIHNKGLKLKLSWDDPMQHFYDLCEIKAIYPQLHIKSNGNLSPSPYLPISYGNYNEMSIKDLMDGGYLEKIFKDDFMKICKSMKCVDDLSLANMNLPINFFDDDKIMI